MGDRSGDDASVETVQQATLKKSAHVHRLRSIPVKPYVAYPARLMAVAIIIDRDELPRAPLCFMFVVGTELIVSSAGGHTTLVDRKMV